MTIFRMISNHFLFNHKLNVPLKPNSNSYIQVLLFLTVLVVGRRRATILLFTGFTSCLLWRLNLNGNRSIILYMHLHVSPEFAIYKTINESL